MVSHIVKLLRQGVWPSLTGGWYFDPLHSEFTNVFHLYIWLLLMCLPLTLYQVFTPSWEVATGYIIGVLTLFIALKIVNWRLHDMFDNGEVINQKHLDLPVTSSNTVLARVEEEEDPNNDNVQPESTTVQEDVFVSTQETETGEQIAVDKPTAKTEEKSATANTEKIEVHRKNEKSPELKVKKVKPKRKREKPINIGRCNSVSSVSSSSSSGWQSMVHEHEKYLATASSSEADDSIPIKHRIIRKRGIRGHRHHPWPHHNEKISANFHQKQAVDTDSSSDEATKTIVTKTSILRRKRVSGDQPSLSPVRKKLAADDDIHEDDEDDKTKNCKTNATVSPNRSTTLALLETNPVNDNVDVTSDQELLGKDPVWHARMSRRYNSDHRLFNRRQTYTVNRQQRWHSERSAADHATMPPEPDNHDSSKLIKIFKRGVNKMWDFGGGNAVPTDHPLRPPTPIPSPVLAVRADDVEPPTTRPSSAKHLKASTDDMFFNTTPLRLSESSSYNSNPHCHQLKETTSRRQQNVGEKTLVVPAGGAGRSPSTVVTINRPRTRRGMFKIDRLQLESDGSSDDNELTKQLAISQRWAMASGDHAPMPRSALYCAYPSRRYGPDRTRSHTDALRKSSRKSGEPHVAPNERVPSASFSAGPSTSGQVTSTRVRRTRHPAGQRTVSQSDDNEGKVVSLDDAAATVHIAQDHNDTTTGAVHTFQDEDGKWFSYKFDDKGLGVAEPLTRNEAAKRRTNSEDVESNSFESLKKFDSPPTSANARQQTDNFFNLSDPYDVTSVLRQNASPSQLVFPLPATPKIKLFYRYWLLPWKSVILQYDRLRLLDLLDRNRHMLENALSILLAVVCASCGFALLWQGYFKDVWPIWFCIVIATAQYSLVRSVQPDTASPSHGHNRVIAYSRPVYFIIICLLILLFDHFSQQSLTGFKLYGHYFFSSASCGIARNILLVLVMILPFIFLLGLLPQINTFLIYLCEQTDIHMFGGTACSGVFSGLFRISCSAIAILPLYGLCYGAMSTKDGSKHILFSAMCGILVSTCYHLSRQPANPRHLWLMIKRKFFPHLDVGSDESLHREAQEENPDNISTNYVQQQMISRLKLDMFLCPLLAVFMFAIHCSTAFKVLQPVLSYVLYIIAGVLGFLLHYILPQLRKQFPWLLLANPVLKSHEYSHYEVTKEARMMWFERMYVWCCFFERCVLYPVIIMNELTTGAPIVLDMYGIGLGSFIVAFTGLKLVRSVYCLTQMHYIALTFAVLFKHYDGRSLEDSLLVTYFFTTILYVKIQEMLLKLQFVYVYVAPWQITWGSAFHAFAQPFSVPHSGMLLVHTVLSSLLHAPLTPFLGSAVFFTSYVRPLKFWERDYNTKRVDHSNTRLATQLDSKNMGSDNNNLNSIFYEHLTLALQKSLSGDVQLGRWGNVSAGDCFIMASEYLNAFVHVIELGNGALTFQLRGLEFSGTYCQQREVEAITEGITDAKDCCCVKNFRLKQFLAPNTAFHQRWLAWQIESVKYVVDGYSITDNSATTMLGVFDLRKVLIGYLVKSVIYFLICNESLEQWIDDEAIRSGTSACEAAGYADTDPSFVVSVDEDYDVWIFGVSRKKFCFVYNDWIEYCASKRKNSIPANKMSKLVSLCFSISVMARRALGTASQHMTTNHVVVESFLYGLHALFKGDFRITSSKDEWVFTDMDMLHQVVVPGVRMSLKLHQDHFTIPDEYSSCSTLYLAIEEYRRDMIITHEADPEWRRAVLSNKHSLLALRNVAGDVIDSYYVIMLKRRWLEFRVVRVNRECVRGLWAGQQQELIFLRNRNPERGSIQNAKQVLRNMINSSCDQPIGYPIYVSPLTTSFANSHKQASKLAGGNITYERIKHWFQNMWQCLRESCAGSCNSGGSAGIVHIRQGQPVITTRSHSLNSATTIPTISEPEINRPRPGSTIEMVNMRQKPLGSSASLSSNSRRCHGSSRSSSTSNVGSGKTLPESSVEIVKITEVGRVFENLNKIRDQPFVHWPCDKMRSLAGKPAWGEWKPQNGTVGEVVHRWFPSHRDTALRSHIGEKIVVIKVNPESLNESVYVPIPESCVASVRNPVTETTKV